MELGEKLQALRKNRGLTQEELAEALYVSRTAVSKWESGRGYPNIDSLKALAGFYGVTIDELLSGDEVLTIAEEDCQQSKQSEAHLRDRIFGLLDVSAGLLLFLPLFAARSSEGVRAVSLLALTDVSVPMKAVYLAVTVLSILWGVLTLALQTWERAGWIRWKHPVSLAVHAAGVLLFILGMHPYATAFWFLFLAIKATILFKRS
jgi:transcriptional regulator with XRE-family HTH domain